MPTTPQGVAANVKLCVETGVAGLSIEDYSGNDAEPLYPFELAVARVRAARGAIGDSGVLLTGRSEGFIRGRPDMDETVRRLKAYAEAGADCLYAPGIRTREQIETVVKAVAPKPVNLLMGGPLGFTVDGHRRHGRAPHQRRRHAGARRDACLHQVGARDRRAGHVRQFRRRDGQSPNSTHFSARTARAGKNRERARHPNTGQPIGPPVDDDAGGAARAGDAAGPLRARGEARGPHTPAILWHGGEGPRPDVDLYAGYGPFTDAAAFAQWVAERADARRPLLLCDPRRR